MFYCKYDCLVSELVACFLMPLLLGTCSYLLGIHNGKGIYYLFINDFKKSPLQPDSDIYPIKVSFTSRLIEKQLNIHIQKYEVRFNCSSPSNNFFHSSCPNCLLIQSGSVKEMTCGCE